MTTNNVPRLSRRHGLPFELSPLGECSLGDVVGLPDGRSLTVRSIAVFEAAVSTMAGFVVLGECEYLVAAPSRQSLPHSVYLPVGDLRAAKGAHAVIEGACAYWAPHLPALHGAMGELMFRVLDVPGSVDPWVVVHRGPEVLVFVRTGEMDVNRLRVTYMPRPQGHDPVEVVRHAATVIPVPTPHSAPAPQEVPQQVPAAVPVR